ncbi:MAG TPA: hypothetical protein VJI12_04090 [archaeon]|nr:hypothetical protein [archaeon]
MKETSREERITYCISRGLRNGKIVYGEGETELSIREDPESAFQIYSELVQKYGAKNVSILRRRNIEVYEDLSPEELQHLAIAK